MFEILFNLACLTIKQIILVFNLKKYGKVFWKHFLFNLLNVKTQLNDIPLKEFKLKNIRNIENDLDCLILISTRRNYKVILATKSSWYHSCIYATMMV